MCRQVANGLTPKRICSIHKQLTIVNWPRGPMDKASAYGAGDCRFESCRGHFVALLPCVFLGRHSSMILHTVAAGVQVFCAYIMLLR